MSSRLDGNKKRLQEATAVFAELSEKAGNQILLSTPQSSYLEQKKQVSRRQAFFKFDGFLRVTFLWSVVLGGAAVSLAPLITP